jgi:hypothetical protein
MQSSVWGAGMGGMGCRRVGEQRVLPLCHQNCLWDNVSFGEQQMRGASFWFYIFCFGAFETEVFGRGEGGSLSGGR